MPNKPTYDTSFAVAEGFGSIRENYKRLIHFVCESAARYKRGATSKKFRTYIPKHLTTEVSIKPSHDINSSLFVNALLWYIFTEAGIDKKMLDKRGHQYPSNGIYHIYQRSWSSKEISINKISAFKRIHTACSSLLEIAEHEWVRTMEQVIIPLFLAACQTHSTPIYDAESRTYCLENKQATIAWLVKLVQSILIPGKDGPITSVILRGMDKTISEWDTSHDNKPEVEVKPADAIPVEKPVERPEKPCESASVQLEDYTPEELLVHAVKVLTTEDNREAWMQAVDEKIIKPLQFVYRDLLDQEDKINCKKNSVSRLMEVAYTLRTQFADLKDLRQHISL